MPRQDFRGRVDQVFSAVDIHNHFHQTMHVADPKMRLALAVAFAAAIFFGFNWYIDHKVISDSIERYDIAKRSGELRQVCSLAGSVSAAQLSAKREAEYRHWRKVETEACAGLR